MVYHYGMMVEDEPEPMTFILCAMQSLYIVAEWCADPDEQREFRWVWWPQLQKTMTACFDLDCADLL